MLQYYFIDYLLYKISAKFIKTVAYNLLNGIQNSC